MRVDFYLLKKASLSGEQLACRLIEKAYERNHRVLVYCQTAHRAALFDDLLWTYQADSFIPHSLQGAQDLPQAPIQITYDDNHTHFNDILLNMTATIPRFHAQFQRIIEIVQNNEEAKIISRQHYKTYRSLQYELHTHSI